MEQQEKQNRYAAVLADIAAITAGQHVEVSVMANVSAALSAAFADDFLWTGFYLVRDGELVLGPFQGPVACYKIRRGRGVCGTAWDKGETQVVPDVDLFPGHIACSSLSRSEIVVPLRGADGEVVAVLDIDSPRVGTFDDVDRQNLERLCALLSSLLYSA